jgi:aminoglycoside phosphotransferase (APT) family kinase protein
MVINEEAIRAYFYKKYREIHSIAIKKLGSGVQGSGFLVEIRKADGMKSYVVKALVPEGLGHDYPSDRASVFLLDLDEFNNLPKHVRAVDVLAEMDDGAIQSIGGGKEYYLLMEQAAGRHYFHDLSRFFEQDTLTQTDRARINAMTSYLAEIHAVKKSSKALYWRKLRDTVGHGECLMGVFDAYPDGTLPYEEMKAIIRQSVDWVYALKPKHKRLSQIHGDFHPGNIWFNDTDDFILLDRSRGPWGEPADDVTALTINYIFFSVRSHGEVRGTFRESLELFFDAYIKASGDAEITEVAALFFAFRAVVIANPVFYPDLGTDARTRLIRFAKNVLSDDSFKIERVNDYINA